MKNFKEIVQKDNDEIAQNHMRMLSFVRSFINFDKLRCEFILFYCAVQ